jgi:ferrous iron transport protein B
MKNIVLIGNPNCGKTTIFNHITKSRCKIANYPGVTVEKKEGFFQKDKKIISVVDLPGVYSLSCHSTEEKVVRDYILEKKPDLIVNIIDASQIERSLFLTLQFK